jgi:hypothetical protein
MWAAVITGAPAMARPHRMSAWQALALARVTVSERTWISVLTWRGSTIPEPRSPKQTASGKPTADLMNAYLTAMTEVIRRHGGTLDKYIGDAIVAFWGAPIDYPQHARHAVMAGLEMQAELQTLINKFRDRNWPALQVGIGINTGPMTVGDMGSRIRLAYTVIGDAVNLGARLEGLPRTTASTSWSAKRQENERGIWFIANLIGCRSRARSRR